MMLRSLLFFGAFVISISAAPSYGPMFQSIAEIISRSRAAKGASWIPIEVDACVNDPVAWQTPCSYQVPVSGVEQLGYVTIIFVPSLNQSSPVLIASFNRSTRELSLTESQEPALEDYFVEIEYNSSFTPEAAYRSLLKNLNASASLLTFNYRRPLFPCVNETLFIFNTPPNARVADDYTFVGSDSGRVCSTAVTFNFSFAPCTYPDFMAHCFNA